MTSDSLHAPALAPAPAPAPVLALLVVAQCDASAALLPPRDFMALAALCRHARAALNHPLAWARWARARFPHAAIARLYALHPELLTPAIVASLASPASIPRIFVLMLVRERIAADQYASDLQAHNKYQMEVKRMLEWRAMELEAQRMTMHSGTNILATSFSCLTHKPAAKSPFLHDQTTAKTPKSVKDIHDLHISESEEDDASRADTHTIDSDTDDAFVFDAYVEDVDNSQPTDTDTKTALAFVPLPSISQIPPVPHPEPLAITNTSRLRRGVREAILEAGEDIYGHVFLASNAPSDELAYVPLLPYELQWAANVSIDGSAGFVDSPVSSWPFDDAAMFSFTLNYAMEAKFYLKVDAPKDFPGEKADQSKDNLDKPVITTMKKQPAVSLAEKRNQEVWRKACETIWCLINKHGFVPEYVICPRRDILGGLEPFLPKSAILDLRYRENNWTLSEVLHFDPVLGKLLASCAGIDNVYAQILVDSKIHIPPRRHSPPTPDEEAHMRKLLSNLPKPLPATPLARYLKMFASQHAVQRICEYTATPEMTVRSHGEALLAELMSPENLMREQGNGQAVTLAAIDNLIDSCKIPPDTVFDLLVVPMWSTMIYANNPQYSASAAVSSNDAAAVQTDDLDDLLSSYHTVARPSNDCPFLTRVGRVAGMLPWTIWRHFLARFKNPESSVWKSAEFAPSASKAYTDFVSVAIHDLAIRRPGDSDLAKVWFGEKDADAAMQAFLQECGGIIASGIHVFPVSVASICSRVVEDSAHGASGRAVRVMALVERAVLDAVAHVSKGGENEAEQQKIINGWVELLTWCVVENPLWLDIASLANVKDDFASDSVIPQVRFFWAVCSLVEDAANGKGDALAHRHFMNWVKQLDDASKIGSPTSLSVPPELVSVAGGSKGEKPRVLSSTLTSVAARAQDVSSAIGSMNVVRDFSAKMQPVLGRARRLSNALAASGFLGGVQGIGSQVVDGIGAGARRVSSAGRDAIAAVQMKLDAAEVVDSEVMVAHQAAEPPRAGGASSKKPVLLSDGADKQKEAWEDAYSRLSGRLSTAKK
ncbi:hypothetical protein HDU83_009845 [Entophlyctis luteolus]|nr:hypothetical protein HDU83_009845 [Entophlyctis luteolus]